MEDRDAIRSCLEGHREAFRELVERYQKEALAHALSLCGELESAKDSVQEAFLDAFRSLDRFDLNRPFYPWLYVMLRHRCLKRIKRRTVGMTADSLLLLEAPPGLGARARELEEGLLLLRPEEREILVLKYLDGLSYRQVADRLGLPMGTVMSRLFYARRSLREKLDHVREELR